jgi:hypothetical protein
MTSGPRRYRSGYRNRSTGDWAFGIPNFSDAVVGYFDPDTNQWYEGVADILSGEWIPVAAARATGRDCPPNLPVKGNLPSRVFHVPGQPNYERVIPEVCFASEEAALDGGFRASRSGEGLHGAAAAEAAAPFAAAAAASAAPAAAAANRANIAAPPPPPPPPVRPAPPPPAPEGNNTNWLWWLLGALAIAVILWWLFFRPQPAPVPPAQTPAATVSAPAAGSPTSSTAPAVATPKAGASPVAGSPVAGLATPVSAAEATPARIASPVSVADETKTPTSATPKASPEP